MEPALEYANVTGRPSSRLVRAASALSRGVASVQRQHLPYAQAWHAANLLALGRPGPRWIVFGDSMSQGIGAHTFDAGWVNQAHTLLALDLPIVNLSASGARVPDLLAQQLPAWRALPPTGSPDLVTVLVGSNDLMSKQYREQLADGFAELLRQLPDGAIVATLPQPRGAAEAVNAHIAAAVASGHITAVDMRRSGPSSWRGKLAADHFHPNEAGYRAIAEAFADPIAATLARRDSAEAPTSP